MTKLKWDVIHEKYQVAQLPQHIIENRWIDSNKREHWHWMHSHKDRKLWTKDMLCFMFLIHDESDDYKINYDGSMNSWPANEVPDACQVTSRRGRTLPITLKKNHEIEYFESKFYRLWHAWRMHLEACFEFRIEGREDVSRKYLQIVISKVVFFIFLQDELVGTLLCIWVTVFQYQSLKSIHASFMD
jgi:hypothetical protein